MDSKLYMNILKFGSLLMYFYEDNSFKDIVHITIFRESEELLDTSYRIGKTNQIEISTPVEYEAYETDISTYLTINKLIENKKAFYEFRFEDGPDGKISTYTIRDSTGAIVETSHFNLTYIIPVKALKKVEEVSNSKRLSIECSRNDTDVMGLQFGASSDYAEESRNEKSLVQYFLYGFDILPVNEPSKPQNYMVYGPGYNDYESILFSMAVEDDNKEKYPIPRLKNFKNDELVFQGGYMMPDSSNSCGTINGAFLFDKKTPEEITFSLKIWLG